MKLRSSVESKSKTKKNKTSETTDFCRRSAPSSLADTDTRILQRRHDTSRRWSKGRKRKNARLIAENITEKFIPELKFTVTS